MFLTVGVGLPQPTRDLSPGSVARLCFLNFIIGPLPLMSLSSLLAEQAMDCLMWFGLEATNSIYKENIDE